MTVVLEVLRWVIVVLELTRVVNTVEMAMARDDDVTEVIRAEAMQEQGP